jgi:hypothetical protein
VSDDVFDKRKERWPEDEGCNTKEAYYYRDIFESIFPGKGPASTAIRWIPRTDWKGVSSDPSGRVSLASRSLLTRNRVLTTVTDDVGLAFRLQAQSVHVAAYETASA